MPFKTCPRCLNTYNVLGGCGCPPKPKQMTFVKKKIFRVANVVVRRTGKLVVDKKVIKNIVDEQTRLIQYFDEKYVQKKLPKPQKYIPIRGKVKKESTGFKAYLERFGVKNLK